MTLFFSQKQDWYFKTALANYSTWTVLPQMETYREHQKNHKKKIIAKRQLARTSTFTFNGNVIEACKSYPYVGSLISNNGQFKLNISKLCKSASSAM